MKNGYFTGGYNVGYHVGYQKALIDLLKKIKALIDLLKKIKVHKNEFDVEIIVYRDMLEVIKKLKGKLK